MSLDIWVREDVARILASKAQAGARYTGEEYREGYLDALSDVALAFGLVPLARQLTSETAYQHTSIPEGRERWAE